MLLASISKIAIQPLQTCQWHMSYMLTPDSRDLQHEYMACEPSDNCVTHALPNSVRVTETCLYIGEGQASILDQNQPAPQNKNIKYRSHRH